MEIIELQTDRLLMRQWHKEDWLEFSKLNADPVVMEYYPCILNNEESNAMTKKITSLLSQRGWGFWAVELVSDKSFIGFVGLHEPTYQLPVTPCVEIGWRLAAKYWGQGYATEAANASLKLAFEKLALPEVYSFTSVANGKSRAVMERLKMVNTRNNFEHPILPENHPLREHVLYKITREQWLESGNQIRTIDSRLKTSERRS